MIYLSVFWSLVVLFIILDAFASLFKNKLVKSLLEKYGILYFIIAASFAIMAIITKDPVAIAGITIPIELQWLGSIIITGFGAWRFYLNPLKERVVSLEVNYASIKADMEGIKTNMETNFNYIKAGINELKERVNKIAQV